ncbi:flagellar basal body protein FliL [Sulfuricella sp. T08]|uniref:flagellar basal body-associated protein FliL n=1 Tax=Sulfuricella sp. T08 TaxID=1632857 RepID=UPI000617A15D|nr:flagellar basal body-associated protein FliL [Sulfuricella sp. T08]GAO37483.1 flagellar basal body protein FliL [Sulfuricella sp. T08]
MARDKAKKEEVVADEPPKKKGKLFPILGILLVLGGAGGGAAWYFTQSDAKPAEHKEEKQQPPVFVTLETFTVNLQADGGGEHYLQVGIDLKVTDPVVVELVKLHMPEVRNGVLLLLSSKSAEQIASLEGKQKLSAEIQEQVNKPLNAKISGKGVTGVFFTSFVIQ